MTRDKRSKIKERLLQLIRMHSTGTPADLAWMFGISERSVKRLIRELKNEGHYIVFLHSANTYIFENDFGQDISQRKCSGQKTG
ncbi:MAG TPA: Lrp/AsnC family transcriptional regulator [Bacteroidales bacterium]|nr:Lrp/AsnC family transcriptional regulator [Bacteroidales bacterium]HQM70805.1 Lrp/AsnC family transcriptional regulator [Bacteroidales bacterium]